ncbi:hypothetical protein BJV78DRAFT_1155118 [Lactifluus subvellereus]|nr:hypothetical protein BJV78DRAFT_1155118 [Lactifluus subvellereus]
MTRHRTVTEGASTSSSGGIPPGPLQKRRVSTWLWNLGGRPLAHWREEPEPGRREEDWHGELGFRSMWNTWKMLWYEWSCNTTRGKRIYTFARNSCEASWHHDGWAFDAMLHAWVYVENSHHRGVLIVRPEECCSNADSEKGLSKIDDLGVRANDSEIQPTFVIGTRW